MAHSAVWQLLSPVIGAVVGGSVASIAGAADAVLVGASAVGVLIGAFASMGRRPDQVVAAQRGRVDVPVAVEDNNATLHALQNLPLGLLIIGTDRNIVFVNRMAGAMFGVRGGDEQPASTLRTRRLLDQMEEVFKGGQPSILNFTLSRMGDANLKAHFCPLDTGDVMIAIEDETQAQRAGAMHRDFVANASHELKTPLAAIQGIIETLLGHARHDPDATERFLGLLQSQATRMTRLVEDLLSLNRIELNARVLPSDQNDVIGVVKEAADALRPIAETDDIAIKTKLSDGAIWALSDRDELGQLFGNLIDNAIKYGGGGTTVTIASRDGAGDTADMIGIEVTDEGRGIAREHIPRLTERFYRVNVGASRAKGGTGLGLAIVKHILSRHRGRLEIESTLGEGSTFRVWLPVSKQAQQDRNATNESANAHETAH